jgi:hypothetical protein
MRLSQRALLLGAGLACLASGGCVPPPKPTPAPTPAPASAPPPAPTPPPAPPPFSGAWMDAPVTPGDWRYAAGTATFFAPDGSTLLTLRCGGGAVTLERAGVGNEFAPTLIVRSEFLDRALSPTATAGPPGSTAGSVAAQDPLLDAIAFSKGRFAVESAGLPTLYVPPYPEVTRVIEDCR